MISLRQHAISIAAIFFALALGVVLGSQTIASDLLSGLRDDRADLQHEVDGLQAENTQLQLQAGAADGFDAAVSGRILANSLADRTVVVFTTPDANPADVDAVTRNIEAAGAKVTGRVGLTDAFIDVASGDRLRTTISNVIPAGVQLRTAAVDQGSLAGDLLGSVLLLDAATAQPQSSPQDTALALETLRGGGFVTYDDARPGQLALVVTGGNSGNDGNRGSIVSRFAAALDGRGAGAALAGLPASAEGSGPIAVSRADTALAGTASTIDNINTEAGRITVALALAEQLNGGVGRYGTGPNSTAVTVGAIPS
ncbi:copper transporter [Aldersonia kunmingensis]|uniref:copper transporter n=1 Tax=Aldersonia kunmingensis TaxID=408066 RepID=UPI00082E6FF9|nr:copper transporter [Aldersonia kunmingensis]